MDGGTPFGGHGKFGGDLGGSGIAHPTTVSTGTQNPLFFLGLPVRWADYDAVRIPNISEKMGGETTYAGQAGPSGSTAQGSMIGVRFASALNTHTLKLRKPRAGVTVAVPRPTANDVPDQRSAFLQRTRGFVTQFPTQAPQRWDAVGGGTAS